LLELLACPLSKERLALVDNEFHCAEIGIAYPLAEISIDDSTKQIPNLVP
jgi:uncharacterized protein YbaR (Trm112 family)